MMDNEKLIESLRGCARGDYSCNQCVSGNGAEFHPRCRDRLLITAADALENYQKEIGCLEACTDSLRTIIFKLQEQLKEMTEERDAARHMLKVNCKYGVQNGDEYFCRIDGEPCDACVGETE